MTRRDARRKAHRWQVTSRGRHSCPEHKIAVAGEHVQTELRTHSAAPTSAVDVTESYLKYH